MNIITWIENNWEQYVKFAKKVSGFTHSLSPEENEDIICDFYLRLKTKDKEWIFDSESKMKGFISISIRNAIRNRISSADLKKVDTLDFIDEPYETLKDESTLEEWITKQIFNDKFDRIEMAILFKPKKLSLTKLAGELGVSLRVIKDKNNSLKNKIKLYKTDQKWLSELEYILKD